jgi:hypothetical protein
VRLQHRFACVAILVLALAGACSSNSDKSATTSTSSPVTSAIGGGSGATVTSVGGATTQNVQDGALCPNPGARGTTQGGQVMTCTLVGTEYHWRPS